MKNEKKKMNALNQIGAALVRYIENIGKNGTNKYQAHSPAFIIA